MSPVFTSTSSVVTDMIHRLSSKLSPAGEGHPGFWSCCVGQDEPSVTGYGTTVIAHGCKEEAASVTESTGRHPPRGFLCSRRSSFSAFFITARRDTDEIRLFPTSGAPCVRVCEGGSSRMQVWKEMSCRREMTTKSKSQASCDPSAPFLLLDILNTIMP